jgi:hypothetical protein
LFVNWFLRLGNTMAELSWIAKLLRNKGKIVVTDKVASAGGARFGCGWTDFWPPVDATAR